MIIRNIVASFFLVFIGFFTSGQNLDSLTALLAGKAGLEKVDVLFDICYDLHGVDSNRALKYGRRGAIWFF